MKDYTKTDWFDLGCLCLLAVFALWQTVKYIRLGNLTAFVTVAVLEALVLLFGLLSLRGRMPWLMVLAAVGLYVVHFITSYGEYKSFNWIYLVQCALCDIWAIAGTVLQLRGKEPIRPMSWLSLGLIVVIAGVFLLTWLGKTRAGKQAEGQPRRELWAVPSRLDAVPSSRPGTLEELVYDTRAYGTDGRSVQKRALVYLPYGYDESRQYNILYLMHGTGDDENYWLKTHAYNKIMLDRMIEEGYIEPLIVVTPTFYVEDDFKDAGASLDPLTFSFKDELRNDLMPLVESRYATYAPTADEAGFIASRDHRAFAGLSRGSVTTCHAAFCGSLDYFSWFGMFSAFRTERDYLVQTLQSPAFRDYPIHYLYMTTGNFDFALPNQVSGYEMLLQTEPRLQWGENTTFDTFPMRYHSIGNWHLALYNFLQKIF